MKFIEHVERCRGSFIKARVSYMRERKWRAEDWYTAWQTTDLPRDVVHAAETKA